MSARREQTAQAWSESLAALIEIGVPRKVAAEWLRVLLDSLQRIAETEARLLTDAFAGSDDVASTLTATTGPLVERAHRRLVVSAIERDLARGAPTRGAIEAVIVFVDVVSFMRSPTSAAISSRLRSSSAWTNSSENSPRDTPATWSSRSETPSCSSSRSPRKPCTSASR